MTNHTPAPWNTEKITASGYRKIVAKDSMGGRVVVAKVFEQPNISDDAAHANARLVAAAPELLDALRSLWKSCILADQTASGRIHLQHAERIIAKAEGK